MGACCSCRRVLHFDHQGNYRHHNYINGDDKEDNNIIVEDDHHGVVGKGDFGANIRLHGYSKFVSMYSQQGKKGINQDAMTVWEVLLIPLVYILRHIGYNVNFNC